MNLLAKIKLLSFSVFCVLQISVVSSAPSGSYSSTCTNANNDSIINCTITVNSITCKKCKKANSTWGTVTTISNCIRNDVSNCNGVLVCGVCPPPPPPPPPPAPVGPVLAGNCLGISAQQCSGYANCFLAMPSNSCRPVLYCPTLNQSTCSGHGFICSWDSQKNACTYNAGNNLCVGLNKANCNKLANSKSNDNAGACNWNNGKCQTGPGPIAP